MRILAIAIAVAVVAAAADGQTNRANQTIIKATVSRVDSVEPFPSIVITNATELAKLTSFFGDIPNQKATGVAGGWEAKFSIAFELSDGGMFKVTKSDDDRDWSSGKGDHPLKFGLSPFLERLTRPEQVYPKDAKAVAALASRSIPYVKEFLEVYPETRLETCYPASVLFTTATEKDVRETFYLCATVGLHRRYVLTMTIRFKMSPDQQTVTSFKDPAFNLQEVQGIKITPLAGVPGGQARIRTTVVAEFDYDQFKTLKAHQGDFSSIGIAVKKDAPVENFDREWKPEK